MFNYAASQAWRERHEPALCLPLKIAINARYSDFIPHRPGCICSVDHRAGDGLIYPWLKGGDTFHPERPSEIESELSSPTHFIHQIFKTLPHPSSSSRQSSHQSLPTSPHHQSPNSNPNPLIQSNPHTSTPYFPIIIPANLSIIANHNYFPILFNKHTPNYPKC